MVVGVEVASVEASSRLRAAVLPWGGGGLGWRRPASSRGWDYLAGLDGEAIALNSVEIAGLASD